jgi:galactokinase
MNTQLPPPAGPDGVEPAGRRHPSSAQTSIRQPADKSAVAFTKVFGYEPEGCWWAPGRVNLIGEHTDYNDGLVLPLAIGQGVAVTARVRNDAVLQVHSLQQHETVRIPLADITPGSMSGWGTYSAGVAWALRRRGHQLPGLDLLIYSDVPTGAGLSSSAALECAVALAWNDIADLQLDRDELAAVASSAENDVVGAPTGVMDQMASLHGRAGHLVFLDTRSMSVDYVPFDLSIHDLALLVIDTRSPHQLVDGEYAERRQSCHKASGLLGVRALRDLSPDDLEAALDRLDDDRLRRRVRHVVTENARVEEVVTALRSRTDPRVIGPILTASHASMRDNFQITVPQVDTAVTSALAAGAHGARMTGGGFGGSVIALVDNVDVDKVAAATRNAYAKAGFDRPATFTVTPEAGAHRL